MTSKKIEPTDAMILAVASTRKLWGLDFRYNLRTILRAALNHPDAPGLFMDEDGRPWEPLNGGRVHPGDELRHESLGVATTAVVARVDEEGDPRTAEGECIGLLEYGTWYVRRAVQELPTADGAVIVPAEGHEYIEARVCNKTYRAREAVRHWAGGWHAAWRSGSQMRGGVAPEEITPGTWKVDDQ